MPPRIMSLKHTFTAFDVIGRCSRAQAKQQLHMNAARASKGTSHATPNSHMHNTSNHCTPHTSTNIRAPHSQHSFMRCETDQISATSDLQQQPFSNCSKGTMGLSGRSILGLYLLCLPCADQSVFMNSTSFCDCLIQ